MNNLLRHSHYHLTRLIHQNRHSSHLTLLNPVSDTNRDDLSEHGYQQPNESHILAHLYSHLSFRNYLLLLLRNYLRCHHCFLPSG